MLQREITFRENEIGKMKQQINERQEAVSAASVSSQVNQDRSNDLSLTILNKDSQIRKLQDDLIKVKHDYDNMLMTRMSEGTAQMQNEAYRNENARLLSMLAKTDTYKEFAEVALDSGNVRFMDPKLQATQSEMKPADLEKEDWIPEEAYKVAHDFRNKCASNISKAMMNTLLTDLDKIWRAREKK